MAVYEHIYSSLYSIPERATSRRQVISNVGRRSKYESWGWVSLRFFYEGEPILTSAYKKVGLLQ